MGPPRWISTTLFENAFRTYFKDKDIQILEFTSSDCVPTGENYASDLFRTRVTYTSGKSMKESIVSVIVKCKPTDGIKEQVDNDMHMFEKEIQMFKTILPSYYEILGESVSLSPKCLQIIEEPQPMLVLEDLAPLNFKMKVRQDGLDLDHCFLVVEKLAKLHAASVVAREKNPSLMGKSYYSEGLYVDTETIREWIMVSLRALIEASSKWPGCDRYSAKLKALGDFFVTRALAIANAKKGEFSVLNHGDLWVNNILFSYHPDGKVKDLRFLDFQLPMLTSPAIDLHYFIATSPSLEVRRNNVDDLLDHYYAQLLATFTRLRYSLAKVPTREIFLDDFKTRWFYGLLAAVTILPLVVASSRIDATFERLMEDEGDDSFRFHCYNNNKYRNLLEYLLSHYDNLGLLD